MIVIKPSPTADTRTCDPAAVTRGQLLESSLRHITDVRQALHFFQQRITRSMSAHDADKIAGIDAFHGAFAAGRIVESGWHAAHCRANRHHLTHPEGVPDDVDLIDVLDYIADCVMAGMARTGTVYQLELSENLLRRAFANTVALLRRNVRVEP